MKILIITYLLLVNFIEVRAQIDRLKIKEDLEEILLDISSSYVYLKDKNINLECIRKHYTNQIKNIKTNEEVVLFFENLLNEFCDSHLILNTNVNSSYRLYSPIYTKFKNGKTTIANVWQSQIKILDQEIIGAEILKINRIDFKHAIDNFPTHCNNKNSEEVREWICNKILAGRYNESRLLTLKLSNGNIIDFDLDRIKYRKSDYLLTSEKINNIGIIRINNSLGNNDLIAKFDQVLDSMLNTKGLIIDLRNTVDGGNSYVARGIMGRFINEPKSYQKHLMIESYDNNPDVERTWIEYVSPRLVQYIKPVVILVGRWTGSMGEGLAVGFDGMGRAMVVGSEMERLAGEINGFSFKYQPYGYRISTAKLFHINGTPREKYVPKKYVKQTTVRRDETLEKGIELIENIIYSKIK